MHTIAYISSYLPTRSETFVYREIRELRRRGWNVICVSLRPPEERVAGLDDLERDRVIVYDSAGSLADFALKETLSHPLRRARMGLSHLHDMVAPGERTTLATRQKLTGQAIAAVSLARRLRTRGVRHIHCHFASAPATIGMYAAIQLGIPFSFTGHANDLFQRRHLLRRKLQRAGFVACISDWHKQFYTQIEPSGSAKYHVVRCGVDVEGWTANPATRPGASLLRIVSVCRLVEKKGVDTLLRGLGLFARRNPTSQFHLTVAGDGPQRPQLESIAQTEQIADRVRFLGAVDNERVRTLLGESDVFALPCRDDASGDRDGIPVVLMEAMACGLPVISGDLPAIRELVRHDDSGLLVDGTSAADVAQAIAAVNGAPDTRARLGQGGRRRVGEEFSLVENVTRLERLFERSIAGATLSARGVVPITDEAQAGLIRPVGAGKQ